MCARARLSGRLIATVIAILLDVGTPGSAAIQDTKSTDEAAFAGLVDQYFDAISQGALDRYVGLWSETAPDREARSQALERTLAANNLTFTPPRLARLKMTGDRATVWTTTRRTTTRKGDNPSSIVTRVALSLEFVREATVWKLWREGSAVAELASELAAAPDDQTREALLATTPDLLTRDLLVLLSGQSDRYYATGDYPRALTINRLNLRIAEILGSKPDQASVWRNIGNLYYLTREYPKAVDAYRKSVALVTEDGDRKFELGGLWTALGLSYAGLGDTAPAIESYQKSLEISRQLDDKAGTANTLDAIAVLMRDQGRYREAGEQYQQVLALRETLRDRASVASTFVNIAEVESDQGEDDRALTFYQKGLAVIESQRRPSSLVHILHHIANLYYVQGNYDLALIHYQREREVADGSGSMPGAAAALSGIGLVQMLYGDFSASIDAYRRCLMIWRELRNVEEQAIALQRLGRAYLAQGEMQKSLAHFQEALELRRGLRNASEIGWALLDVGSLSAVLREFTQSLAAYQEGLKLFEGLDDKSGIGASLIHLAGVHFVQSLYPETIDFAERAANVARAADDTDILWQARFRKARAHYRLQQPLPARQSFSEAIAIVESNPPSSSESRPQRLLDDRLAPYLGMVDVAIHQNLASVAFHYLERAKSRTLRSLLLSNRGRITRTMTAGELANEQRLSRERAVLSSQIARERERKPPQAKRLAELTSRFRGVQAETKAFEQRLYRLRPDLKVLRGEGEVVSIDRLVVPPRTAIVEFAETDEEVYALVFTKAKPGTVRPQLRAFALGVTRRELAERSSHFLQLISRMSDGWEEPARGLYDTLFKPLEETLTGKTNLILVPDGWLWNLPFPALQPGPGTFLIERYALTHAPSLTALSRMRVLRRPIRFDLQLAAVGNPTLAPRAGDRIRVARRSDRLDQATSTEQQVTALGALYRPGSSRILFGAEARSDRIAKEASNARVLHLAVPAVVNEPSPLYSQIAFAPPVDASSDGIVQLREVLSWETKAELMVFSSSELMPPGLSVGRGLLGLSWTALVAGCPSTLTSRWRVDKPGVNDLMLRFHREWQKSRNRARSWRHAALEQLKSADVRHPFHWAGFVMMTGVE